MLKEKGRQACFIAEQNLRILLFLGLGLIV